MASGDHKQKIVLKLQIYSHIDDDDDNDVTIATTFYSSIFLYLSLDLQNCHFDFGCFFLITSAIGHNRVVCLRARSYIILPGRLLTPSPPPGASTYCRRGWRHFPFNIFTSYLIILPHRKKCKHLPRNHRASTFVCECDAGEHSVG